MSDSIIINKFLIREYQDFHQIIYLYVKGGVRSEKLVINEIMKLCNQIFLPGINENFIKTTVKEFLDTKKKLYLKGKVKVKSIY
jgi:hypothetical protein